MTAPSQPELIERGQPLVYSLASKIHKSIPLRIDLEDLIAYGELGLAEAARDFDPERGAQFTTFAYYRIRGSIYDGLAKMSWSSRARWRKMRYEQMANEALADDAVHGPAAGSVGDEARWLRGITEKLAVVYLANAGEEGGGLRDSAIEDPDTPAAGNIAAHREIVARLRELIDSLPRDDSRLIRMVYFDGATLQQAADSMGIHKATASRRHAKALETLARALRRLGAS